MEKKRERCKERVFDKFHHHQCSRYAWKDGYCKQHHPDSVKERDRKTIERWEKKRKASPIYRLGQALKEIEMLKEEIVRLNAIIKEGKI